MVCSTQSIRGDTMGNEKLRRSPTGDQNTNLDDVGARKNRVEDKFEKRFNLTLTTNNKRAFPAN